MSFERLLVITVFGIDLEPNRVQDTLQNVRIENVSLIGNVGGGIQFGLHKLSNFGQPATSPTSITIRNCTVDGRGPILLKNGQHFSIIAGVLNREMCNLPLTFVISN